MADVASPPATVPWNTIFFTLVPLATSVMAQPVGSVLGTNPISRFYLRSSPIFCAIDAFALLVSIILQGLLSRDSFREICVCTIQERFWDCLDEGEGLKDFGRTALLRWVLFLLGTIGSVLKIVTAKGLPWTKAWGLMFFVSFLFFEGIIPFSRKAGAMGRTLPTGVNRSPSRLPPSWSEARHPFARKIVTVSLYLAILGHLALLTYAALKISTTGPKITNTTSGSKLESLYSSTTSGMSKGLPVFVCLVVTIGSLLTMTRIRNFHGVRFFALLFISLSTGSTGVYLFIRQIREGTVWRGGIIVLSAVIGFDLLDSFIRIVATRFVAAGEKLLIVETRPTLPSHGFRWNEEVKMHVWPLVGFIASLVFTLLYYSMSYDAKDTSNAGWTAVFS